MLLLKKRMKTKLQWLPIALRKIPIFLAQSPRKTEEGMEGSEPASGGGRWLPHGLGTQRGTDQGGLVGRARS